MATLTVNQIDPAYPNVLSVAQNRNTGQYLLAIVTASASGAADVPCRVYKSSNYGSTWTLIENLFTNSYTDGRDINYTALASLNLSVFYACAISDDGQHQVIIPRKYGGVNFIWYSNNYGVMSPKNSGESDGTVVGTNTNPGWKWAGIESIVNWPYIGGFLAKFTSGINPVLVGTNGTTIWLDQQVARPNTYVANTRKTIINTRDRAGIQGNEFTFDVPDMFANGYDATPSIRVFVITSGNISRTNDNRYPAECLSASFINPTDWPVSATQGGGVVVTADQSILYAARYVNGVGGIWKSTDIGDTWTKITGNINVNAIAISLNGQYVIACPSTPTAGVGVFYYSSDYGSNWTTNSVSFTGRINHLYITNDGKRAITSTNMTEAAHYIQYSTAG